MSKTSSMLEKAIARLESFHRDEDAYLDAVKEYFYYLNEANHVEYGEKRGLERGIAQGLAQGLERGLAQGRLEGEKKGRLEGIEFVAKSLRDSGTAMDIIMKCTGLTENQIMNL